MIIQYKIFNNILNKNFFYFLDKKTLSFRLVYWKYLFFFLFFFKVYFLFMQSMFINNINYFIFYVKIYNISLKNKFNLILIKKKKIEYIYKLYYKKLFIFNNVLLNNFYLVL